MTRRWLLCGLILLSACTTLPVQKVPGSSGDPSHPLGYTLPSGAPNLYDNGVFWRFMPVAKRLFQIRGVKLADWLVANIVDEPVYSKGESFQKDILLVHRIGYVTDNRNRAYGRIIALVEILINPQTQDRLILWSLDMGWVLHGEADGVWSETRGTMKPVNRQAAGEIMDPVHRLVAAGYAHYATAHGLPVPTIPVTPIRSEHHRQAMVHEP